MYGKKALDEMWMKMITLIIAVVVLFIFVNMGTSWAKNGSNSFFQILGLKKSVCNFPVATCDNCLAINAVSPGNVEFRSSLSFIPSTCSINSDILTINFNDDLTGSPELRESCLPNPKKTDDWKLLAFPTMGSYVVQLTALKDNCFYSVYFPDSVKGKASGRGMDSAQSFFVFKKVKK